MALLGRNQLQRRYNWRADPGDNPRLTGHPDRDLLDRTEGYEVLRYLNLTFQTNADALKAERGLEYVPSNLRSFENVTRWLVDNWHRFA